MANWPLRKLKEYPLEIIDGDRGKAYPQITDFNCKGYCLFLNAGNVTSTGFNFETCVFITEEKDNELRKGKLESHDIVITTRGTVGNIAYYSPLIPFKHIRINSGMVILRPNVEFIIPEFLYYSLISPFFKNQLKSFTSGSAQPQLPIRDLSNISLYLPSLQQQKSIIEKIKILDQKIELNRKMNETLEQMAQAVFQDWFVDFGPVKRKAKGITDPVAILGGLIPNPAKAQEIANLFPDQFAEDGLPLGSKIIKLQDILELAYGKSLPQKRRVKGSIPVYGSGGITGYHNECLINGPSIIIGRKGSIGTIYWENSPSFPIDTVFYVKSEFPLIYLYFLLKEFDLKAMNTDAAVPGLNRNNVYRLQVPYLNKPVIEKYASLMTPLFSYCRSNLDQNHTLAEMRDLLLPKLMSGEISVDELEKKMGGVL